MRPEKKRPIKPKSAEREFVEWIHSREGKDAFAQATITAHRRAVREAVKIAYEKGRKDACEALGETPPPKSKRRT